MAIKTALLSMNGAIAGLVTLWAGAAMAGPSPACGIAGAPACDKGVNVLPTPRGHSGPATVQNHTPYGFLDSVHFQRSPHVSITRVHGLDVKPDLKDAPIGFTKGCHPSSTAYCRTGLAAPETQPVPKPAAPKLALPKPTPAPVTTPVTAPIVSAPPRIIRPPIVQRPIVQRPIINPCAARMNPRPCGPHSQNHPAYNRVVATAGGFDPSKFTPRIYGNPYTITPGVAYLPTSRVIRDPYQAQAVLDNGPGGVTPALSGLRITPHLPVPYYPYQPRVIAPVQPVQMNIAQPMSRYGTLTGTRATHNRVTPNMTGRYATPQGPQAGLPNAHYGAVPTSPAQTGGYWERVSGPTRYGNTIATEVVCRRQHPQGYPAPRSQAPCGANKDPRGRRY